MPRIPRPPYPIRRLLVVALLALLGTPGLARAGDCTTCTEPTSADLAAAGVTLEMRYSLSPRDYAKDYVEVDAGECDGTLVDAPEVTRDSSYLVLRGEGEVWDCPHSKSVDTVTVTTSETDSTSWTLTAKVGVKVKALAAEVSAEISAGRTQGESITEVTSISKQITPGWCHRIQWKGWFEVSTYRATAEFKFTQRWAWWTKNRLTGDKVHQKGDVYMDCGSTFIEMSRKAPIAGYFELCQSGCGAGCSPIPSLHLGFYPELPERLRPASEPAEVEGADDEPQTDEPKTDEPASDDPPSDDPPASDPAGDDAPETSGDLPDPPGTEDDPPAGTSSDPLRGDGR